MFESRLFFVDKLIDMGAKIILCDPHRATVIGHDFKSTLKATTMTSPDIRAGVSLLIAALSAKGTSTIQNIEQIDRGCAVVELQHRGRNGYSPLLFKFHPVGGHFALLAPGLDSTGLLDCTAVQQQFFRERCFPRIRVRNNRKVATPIHGIGQLLGQINIQRGLAATHLRSSTH